MGGGKWSDDAYADRTHTRSVTNTPAFNYSHTIDTGRAAKAVHLTMAPSAVAGAKSPFVGQVMRESRDSDDHPESLAIVVLFDVTGSMKEIPKVLQTKLAGLMKLLIAKGYAAHPQILFGANGDAYSDKVPLQVGQFESDLSMDDNLTNIYLEGNGGGQQRETYELGLYFIARHTSIDCFEKRGKKGYCFTIGDESFYDVIQKDHVKALIGDELKENISTKQIVRELQEKYHVFHIIAEDGGYPHDKKIEADWRNLLGEQVLLLEDSNNVAELIGLTIGLCEGTTDIDDGVKDLTDIGVTNAAAHTVRDALVPLAQAGVMAKVSTVTGLPAVAGGGGITRV